MKTLEQISDELVEVGYVAAHVGGTFAGRRYAALYPPRPDNDTLAEYDRLVLLLDGKLFNEKFTNGCF